MPPSPAAPEKRPNVGSFTPDEFGLILDVVDLLAQVPGQDGLVSRICLKWNRIQRFHALVLEMPEVDRVRLAGGDPLDTDIDILGVAHLSDFDLRLPGRTIIGKSLIDLEISFWGYLAAAVEGRIQDPVDRTELLSRLERCLCHRIYNRMTAELLASVVSSPRVAEKHRRAAARFLLTLWEEAAIQAMRNFAPLLEGIWEARRQVRVTIGTLMGISEITSMLSLGATEHFIEFFAENFEETEISEAFSEFLFGTTTEELREKTLERERIGLASTAGLDLDATGLPRGAQDSLQERSLGIYRFFKKRIQEARSRRVTGAAGPKRIAEEYLILYFIEHQL